MMELTRDGEDVVLRIRAAELLLKLAAEPERPAPMFKEGDCFVLAEKPSVIYVILQEPEWQAAGERWVYLSRKIGNRRSFLDDIEAIVAHGSWLPCPPRPPEHPTHEPTGEAREPKKGELYFALDGAHVHGPGCVPSDCPPVGRIRWIARLKQPVGIAWLNARIKPDMVFAFRGERYVTGTYLGNPYQICVTPIDRPCHFAVRDRQTDEWRSAAACFRGEVARLSAATVEVIDLGVPK